MKSLFRNIVILLAISEMEFSVYGSTDTDTGNSLYDDDWDWLAPPRPQKTAVDSPKSNKGGKGKKKFSSALSSVVSSAKSSNISPTSSLLISSRPSTISISISRVNSMVSSSINNGGSSSKIIPSTSYSVSATSRSSGISTRASSSTIVTTKSISSTTKRSAQPSPTASSLATVISNPSSSTSTNNFASSRLTSSATKVISGLSSSLAVASSTREAFQSYKTSTFGHDVTSSSQYTSNPIASAPVSSRARSFSASSGSVQKGYVTTQSSITGFASTLTSTPLTQTDYLPTSSSTVASITRRSTESLPSSSQFDKDITKSGAQGSTITSSENDHTSTSATKMASDEIMSFAIAHTSYSSDLIFPTTFVADGVSNFASSEGNPSTTNDQSVVITPSSQFEWRMSSNVPFTGTNSDEYFSSLPVETDAAIQTVVAPSTSDVGSMTSNINRPTFETSLSPLSSSIEAYNPASTNLFSSQGVSTTADMTPTVVLSGDIVTPTATDILASDTPLDLFATSQISTSTSQYDEISSRSITSDPAEETNIFQTLIQPPEVSSSSEHSMHPTTLSDMPASTTTTDGETIDETSTKSVDNVEIGSTVSYDTTAYATTAILKTEALIATGFMPSEEIVATTFVSPSLGGFSSTVSPTSTIEIISSPATLISSADEEALHFSTQSTNTAASKTSADANIPITIGSVYSDERMATYAISDYTLRVSKTECSDSPTLLSLSTVSSAIDPAFTSTYNDLSEALTPLGATASSFVMAGQSDTKVFTDFKTSSEVAPAVTTLIASSQPYTNSIPSASTEDRFLTTTLTDIITGIPEVTEVPSMIFTRNSITIDFDSLMTPSTKFVPATEDHSAFSEEPAETNKVADIATLVKYTSLPSTQVTYKSETMGYYSLVKDEPSATQIQSVATTDAVLTTREISSSFSVTEVPSETDKVADIATIMQYNNFTSTQVPFISEPTAPQKGTATSLDPERETRAISSFVSGVEVPSETNKDADIATPVHHTSLTSKLNAYISETVEYYILTNEEPSATQLRSVATTDAVLETREISSTVSISTVIAETNKFAYTASSIHFASRASTLDDELSTLTGPSAIHSPPEAVVDIYIETRPSSTRKSDFQATSKTLSVDISSSVHTRTTEISSVTSSKKSFQITVSHPSGDTMSTLAVTRHSISASSTKQVELKKNENEKAEQSNAGMTVQQIGYSSAGALIVLVILTAAIRKNYKSKTRLQPMESTNSLKSKWSV